MARWDHWLPPQVLHLHPVQVAHFQPDVVKLLESMEPTLELVQRCLERGEGLEVDLLEVVQRGAWGEQLAWLEEVRELLEDPAEVGLEAVRALKAARLSLQPQPGVQRVLDN